MLTTYLTKTKQLLQNPSSAASLLYTDSLLTTNINLARGQLAGEAECVRNYATLSAPAGTRQLNFSDITLGAPSTGIGGVFNIRQSLVGLGDGQVWMHSRSFPWFTLYALNQIVPKTGLPKEWSQFGQGVTGTIFIEPLPDQDYVLTLDTVCYPVDLVDDATPEAIPYPWTDCVPFFAAYYTLLSAQRMADADSMMQRYEMFMSRARQMSNPDVLGSNFMQSSDPTKNNKLGIRPARQGGPQ